MVYICIDITATDTQVKIICVFSFFPLMKIKINIERMETIKPTTILYTKTMSFFLYTLCTLLKCCI